MADLAAVKARRKGSDEGELTITSMMDMMTIILVFLLKSYSVEDIQVKPSDDLTLPSSNSLKAPEVHVNLVVSKSLITVDGVDVLEIIDGEVAEEDKKGTMVTDLYDVLQQKADDARSLAEKIGGDPFEGKILFQCDKDIKYSTVREVMYTAGQAQFGKFKFVVFKTD